MGRVPVTNPIPGSSGPSDLLKRAVADVTRAQVRALATTAAPIVPAPGSGKALMFSHAYLVLPAGTAYAISTAATLDWGHAGHSQSLASLSTDDITGVTSEVLRAIYPTHATTGSSDKFGYPNNGFEVRVSGSNEITGGGSPLKIVTFYYELDL